MNQLKQKRNLILKKKMMVGINKKTKNIGALFIILLFTLNVSAQSDNDMALEYYKKAKIASEKNSYKTDDYIFKSLSYKVSKSYEPLLYLLAKDYNRRGFIGKASDVLDFYFKLDNLKGSESSVKRYKELVSLRLELDDKISRKVNDFVNTSKPKDQDGNYDNKHHRYYKYIHRVDREDRTKDLTVYKLGRLQYIKTSQHYKYTKHIYELENYTHFVNTEVADYLSPYLKKQLYPKEFEDLFGTYWFNNNGEFNLLKMSPAGVEIYNTKQLTRYQKKEASYPILKSFKSSDPIDITNSKACLVNIADNMFKNGRIIQSLFVYLKVLKNENEVINILKKLYSKEHGLDKPNGSIGDFDRIAFVENYRKTLSPLGYNYLKHQVLKQVIKSYYDRGHRKVFEDLDHDGRYYYGFGRRHIDFIEPYIEKLENKINELDPTGVNFTKYDLGLE